MLFEFNYCKKFEVIKLRIDLFMYLHQRCVSYDGNVPSGLRIQSLRASKLLDFWKDQQPVALGGIRNVENSISDNQSGNFARIK